MQQACSSGCCHSPNSHTVSSIKGWVEAQLHEEVLDVTDHGVPGEWGAGYLEEGSIGSWTAGAVALEQVPGYTCLTDLSVRAPYDHLHPLSKGISLAGLKGRLRHNEGPKWWWAGAEFPEHTDAMSDQSPHCGWCTLLYVEDQTVTWLRSPIGLTELGWQGWGMGSLRGGDHK